MTEDEKRQAVVDLVVAANRMRDDWAESDSDVKSFLWFNLHTAADVAAEAFEVYPL